MDGFPWYDKVALHFFSGVAVSFADRLVSKNATKYTERRLVEKRERAAAIEYLVDAEIEMQNASNRELEASGEYMTAVEQAKYLFHERGELGNESRKGIRRAIDKTADYFKKYTPERVNNLSWRKKLAVAFGLEFFCDAWIGLSQVTLGVGNGVAALGNSLYEAPAFFAGMSVGKGVLYIKDKFKKSDEEKDLDKKLKALTYDGKVLKIIQNYSPTAYLKVHEREHESSSGELMNTGEAGQRLGNAVANAAFSAGEAVSGAVNVIQERISARKAAREEQDRRERAAKSAKLKKSLDGY